MPVLAAAVAADLVPIAHVRTVAAVYANRRVADHLVAADEWVAGHAIAEDHDTFRRMLEAWERLADFDGAHRGADEAHHGRMARITTVGDEMHLTARCGLAQGAVVREILQHFVEAERQLDLDAARATITDRPIVEADLLRKAAQRRFDALHAAIEAAAGAPINGRTPDVLINVVVDQATFEAATTALVTGQVETSGIDPTSARCQLLDGTPIGILDVAAAALIGKIRRVVFDSAGVVINLGRSSRLFTGSAREAALLQGLRCRWPGCGQTHHMQIDHLIPWPSGGPTDPWNAGPLCGYHNRWKHRGYAVRRDEYGRWHVYRPDGSEILAA